MKKLLAVFLSTVMALGMIAPTAAAVELQQMPSDTFLSATELDGMSRLDELAVGSTDHVVEPLYGDDEYVIVIVRLEEASVLDYFEVQTFRDDASAGQAVAKFLNSSEAQEAAELLKEEQQDVIWAIQDLLPATYGRYGASASSLEVVEQWTLLANAMAVKVPYGQLEAIRGIEGVSDAYVETVYELPEPQTDAGVAGYSYDMLGIDQVWAAGYTGENMLVAILDTGLDLEYLGNGLGRVHEAFRDDSFAHEDVELRYTDESIAAFMEQNKLRASAYGNSGFYKNAKVPFAADYADGDLNARHPSNDHGTHVAGTIAGYVETEEGEVKFSGIAPDAQLLIMKVFSDYSSGARETHIITALEDAALLGADVMNLSLGSDNGFTHNDTLANEVYNRLAEKGILFMISAGNSGNSTANNFYYNQYGITGNLTSDPETSMVGSPAVYEGALSVASANNMITIEPLLTWKDADGTEHTIAYNEYGSKRMRDVFGGEADLGINIIPVPGFGTVEDYETAGFRSWNGEGEKGVEGIALVMRGELNFTDKIANGATFTWTYTDPETGKEVTTCPVKAVLICDSNPAGTDMINMSGSETMVLPNAFLAGVEGTPLAEAAAAAVASGKYVTLKNVDPQDGLHESRTPGTMSSFSSWGAPSSLEIKPEITAPGGLIWSAVLDKSNSGGEYTGAYSMMSGTSMAAPHMSGVTALVQQYVRTTLGITDVQACADLTDNLLVSTATPLIDNATGGFYSPRWQGAGLVNAAAAVKTPAYITVEGQRVGKLELLDDPERTGELDFTFTVNNLSNRELTYSATAVLMIPGVANYGMYFMTDSDMMLGSVPLGEVKVPAGGSATVSEVFVLPENIRTQLDTLFPNGTYVEGYVILTSADEDPTIGLPFLSFLGDWTAAPIFDAMVWADEGYYYNMPQWSLSHIGYYDNATREYFILGQNPFDPAAADNQLDFYQENMTVSPYGLFPCINDFTLYQKRDARAVVVEVRDAETGDLYYRDWATYQFKTSFNYDYQKPLAASMYAGNFTYTVWDGTDLNGDILPSGTRCVYTITAYGDGEYPMTDAPAGYGYTKPITDFEAVYPGGVEPTFNGHAMDMTGDVISTYVLVDTVAPKLEGSAVKVYEEDGHVYLTGTFKDDGALASVGVYPEVKCTFKEIYGDPSYVDYGVDLSNPFAEEMIYDRALGAYTFTADVTEYVHENEDFAGQNSYYDFEWTGNVYLFGGDYGGNDRAYTVAVKETSTGEDLILSDDVVLLYVGESFDLSVINNTDSQELVFASVDPEIVVVDEFGCIEALAPGQTNVTVSCGESEASCIVAVREHPTEVVDFDLSVENFSGMKPGGSLVVKVTNLYPHDVELTENSWVITGDDTGLAEVAPYDQTGLAGVITLASSTYGETEVPGSSATLEVTLNGVTRSMTFDWEDLYANANQEDLVSGLTDGQIIYAPYGDSVMLAARHNDSDSYDLSLENNVFGPFDWEIISGEGQLQTGADYYDDSGERFVYIAILYPSAPGEYVVAATTKDGEHSVTFTVICEDRAVEAVTIDDAPSFLYVGKKYSASAVMENMPVMPENEDGIIWASHNTDVVTVDENGVLTAVGVGRAVISASCKYSDVFDTVVVQVTKPGPSDTYIVSFDSMGGSPVPDQVVKVGEKAIRPDNPTKEGYTFVGWFTDPDNSELFNFRKEVTKDVTLYAKWRKSAPVWNEPVLPSAPSTPSTPSEPSGDETVNPDGSVTTTTEDKAAGTVTEVTEFADGTTTTVVTDKDGNADVQVDASASAVADGTVVTLPESCADAEVLNISVSGGDSVTVEVPVEDATPGTVLVIVHEDGTEEVVKKSMLTEDGVAMEISGDVTVKVQDRSMDFDDVSATYWGGDAIDFVSARGVMTGDGTGNFNPNDLMNRASMAVLLHNLENNPDGFSAESFDDVGSTWFTEAVEWVSGMGIMDGYGNGLFGAKDNITREQFAAILYRYAGSPKSSGSPVGFADSDEVSSWAADAMSWAIENGIISGEGNNLNPKGYATRAQVATMLMRFMNIG